VLRMGLAGRASMPARFVVVHDDPEFTDALVEKSQGCRVVHRSGKGAHGAGVGQNVAFLITRLQFTDSQPVGLSLRGWRRRPGGYLRRAHWCAATQDFARGLGEFIESGQRAHVGMIIEWLSAHKEPG